MIGLQRHLRRTVLARMKGAAVSNLVPATSLYSQTLPAKVPWPFVKLGRPQVRLLTATCLNGAQIGLPIDAFARERVEGGAVVETAEDYASRIGEWIETLFHLRGQDLVIAGQPLRISYRLGDIGLVPDQQDAEAFHWSGLITARLLAE